MPHSYVSNLMHCTFSTKERFPFINPGLESRLWPHLGGIARENSMKALAINGPEDHVHGLLSLPATMSFSKAVQLLKGGSSKWIHDTFPAQQKFAWQEGYGAFSVSASQVDRAIASLKDKRNTTERDPSRRSSLRYLRNTESTTTHVIFLVSFSRPFHGLVE